MPSPEIPSRIDRIEVEVLNDLGRIIEASRVAPFRQ